MKSNPLTLLRTSLLATLMLTLTGCVASRVTVIDRNSDWVKLGPDVSGHVYLLQDGKWTRQDRKVHLPEGWVAGPEPK